MARILTDIAISLLNDEASGDIHSAVLKMDIDNYSMTWMYKSRGELFPAVSGEDVKKAMDEAYEIKGRTYEIIHTAEHGATVFIEMIESYPDEKSGKEFRTPIVLVLEFKDGKVVRGRHYTDPQLSHDFLSREDILKAIGSEPRQVIRGN